MKTRPNWRIALSTAASLVALTVLTAPPLAAQQSSADQIRLGSPGKLVVGYTPIDGITDVVNGSFVGLSAYIDNQIGARLGLDVAPASYDFAAVFPALQSHRIDLLGEAVAGTQPRAQVLYLTTPAQIFGAETIVVRPGTQIASWEDAAARHLTLASVKGYFQITAWQDLGITVHAFDNNDACLTDVLNKGADGCAIGSFALVYRKATKPDDPLSGLDQVVVTGPRIVIDNSTIAVNKDNPGLANAVNQSLKDQWRDGTIDKAYQSIFGSQDYSLFLTPPIGANLYIPGPWEDGVTPPAAETFPTVTTVTPGTLTVGVVSNGPLLTFDGGTAGGPEAAFLRFAASKLGLAVSYTSVSDEAAALRSGQVDVVAGQLAITPERTRQYWMTSIPIAFSPDYIYVKPGSDGSFPSYGSWEDVAKAGQTLAVVQGDPRAADIQKAGAQVQAFPTAADALRAVAGGFVGGYVGTTLDYVVSASADGAISNAGIGWVRNTNSYTHGVAYGWGIKPGNDKLVDALDQALTMAWQQHVVSDTYGSTWPGADASAVEAPGPSLVGTGYGSSKDYVWRGIWPSGAWLQRPGYVTQ